jgi:Nitrogenase molybdenum-iron protein, alpha and beta chains
MAVRGIDGAYMMVVGTDECAYYTKQMTIHSEDWGGLFGRCVSAAIDRHDVTFGCAAKTEAAFAELMEEEKPEAVFIVTTCVPEIIGDDFDAIAEALSQKYGIPVMAVHTEHFKCENHMPGVERTITACAKLMKACEKDGSVNILGQRMGRFENTEVSRVLKNAGVRIGAQLPSGCTIADIRRAPSAKVNIVVNGIGLPLAKKMEAQFGTPYVFFDKFTDPKHVAAAYGRLFDFLELPLPAELKGMEERANKAVSEASARLAGVPFIYGNTPFSCFEACGFMTSIGMHPQLIQCHGIGEEDKASAAEILKTCDPYVTQVANITPLQYIYDVLRPQFYLGHEFAARLRKKGIAIVHTDMGGDMLGFEVTVCLMRQLLAAKEEADEIRKETAG